MLRGKRRLYRQGGLVRGNVVIILGNLEILDIVEFLIIFIIRRLGELILKAPRKKPLGKKFFTPRK